MYNKHKLNQLLEIMLQRELTSNKNHEMQTVGYAQEFALCYHEFITPSSVIAIISKMDSFGFMAPVSLRDSQGRKRVLSLN